MAATELNRRQRTFNPAAARVHDVPSPQTSSELTVKAFGITDKGKVRSTNEDQFLIAELTKSMRVWQTSLPRAARRRSARNGRICSWSPTAWADTAPASARAPWRWPPSSTSRSTRSSGSSAPTVNEARKVLAQFQSALTQADAADRRGRRRRTRNCAAWAPPSRWRFNWVRNCASSTSATAARTCTASGELHQLTKDHTLVADLVRIGRDSAGSGRRAPLAPRHHQRRRRPGGRRESRGARAPDCSPAIGCCSARMDCRKW